MTRIQQPTSDELDDEIMPVHSKTDINRTMPKPDAEGIDLLSILRPNASWGAPDWIKSELPPSRKTTMPFTHFRNYAQLRFVETRWSIVSSRGRCRPKPNCPRPPRDSDSRGPRNRRLKPNLINIGLGSNTRDCERYPGLPAAGTAAGKAPPASTLSGHWG